jgi:hypothetical protein
MEELEDRRARLRDGEDGADRDRDNGQREHERTALNERAAGRRLADPAQDTALEVGLPRPLQARAQVAQCELELRHMPPPQSARAAARARATAWT